MKIDDGWIEWLDDRDADRPTKGIVEIIDTEGKGRTTMDMARPDIRTNLFWNRAAPCCVKKYRFISVKEYKRRMLKHLEEKEKRTIESLSREKVETLKYLDLLNEDN